MTQLTHTDDPLALIRAGILTDKTAPTYYIGPETFALMLALTKHADAIGGSNATSRSYVQQTITVAASLGSVPVGAKRALIYFSGEGRWRPDAVNPTTLIGVPFVSGDILELGSASEIAAFRVVNNGALNLDILYFVW